MKNAKISRRSFLLGLAACSAAGVLTACKGTDAPSDSTASSVVEQPASSAASSAVQQAAPFLTVEDFPPLDGSTACIPLMAQMLADTTGMDLEEARSSITVSTTAYAWENFGLYDTTTRMLVVYEAPDYVKEELQEANVELEQKPIGVDALVFIVNEDNPVQALTRQQLRDIYAGKITNWKDVGGKDQEIVAFQRGEDSGSQTLFKKLLIQGGELMTPPSELAPAAMGELVDSIADYNNSANAIGFSVYYYIDQMYSKPGLRLLAVDGVTPSNDTLADGSYPLCNDFYAVIHPDAAADSPERQLYDWLDTEALKKVLDKLAVLVEHHTAPDLMICNYVYEHVEDGTSHTVRYTNVFPQNRLFDWVHVRHFRPDQNLLMHSVMYRTEVLRECGMVLPKHTFYVDNIFVYQPLPYVKSMYYMDLDLYRYFIGRADQSVNESVMVGRVDQQLRVTKHMIDCQDLDALKDQKRLRAYMVHYLSVMMAVSDIFLLLDGTPEAYTKKKELWQYLKDHVSPKVYRSVVLSLGGVSNVNVPGGDKVVLGCYRLAKKLFKFN